MRYFIYFTRVAFYGSIFKNHFLKNDHINLISSKIVWTAEAKKYSNTEYFFVFNKFSTVKNGIVTKDREIETTMPETEEASTYYYIIAPVKMCKYCEYLTSH